MSKLKFAKNLLNLARPIARNAAVGGVAGAVAGRGVSSSEGADTGQHRGAQIGALVGAATGLPFGKLARQGQLLSRTFAAGLKARNPASKTAKVLRGLDKAGVGGKMAFRRIRGKIVPIRSK
jgi:hypothetical protein